MRTIVCIAVGFLATAGFGSATHAQSASQASAKPAVQQAAKPAAKAAKVRHHRASSDFGNWCAYNCYAAPRRQPSRGTDYYAYDEDLPARHYGFDWEASPVENLDAFVYGFTGEPAMRLFERVY